jgi:predicted dehydrogenase
MDNFLSQKDANVITVCDVYEDHRQACKHRVDHHYGKKVCTAHRDFRELLARNDVQALLIATPDHWHVPIAMAAARAGKDMYVEKPMGPSLAEDQALRDAVRGYGAVFQFGTQQRSDRRFRFACELVRNGRIGKLLTINVLAPPSIPGGPVEPAPVPTELDYDMWTGPAPFAPYAKNRCFADDWSQKTWWFTAVYSLGFIAGWGIHPLDIALWGGDAKLTGPVEIEGKGSFPTEGACDTATDWSIVFRYASSVTINFRSCEQDRRGYRQPPAEWKKRYAKIGGYGTAFEGTEGWVFVDRANIVAHPKSLLDTVLSPTEVHLYESNDHVRNFLDCVRSRAQTICPIDVAVRSDTMCHLADICLRVERKLKWDLEKECFISDDIANRMLSRAMRSPWHL